MTNAPAWLCAPDFLATLETEGLVPYALETTARLRHAYEQGWRTGFTTGALQVVLVLTPLDEAAARNRFPADLARVAHWTTPIWAKVFGNLNPVCLNELTLPSLDKLSSRPTPDKTPMTPAASRLHILRQLGQFHAPDSLMTEADFLSQMVRLKVAQNNGLTLPTFWLPELFPVKANRPEKLGQWLAWSPEAFFAFLQTEWENWVKAGDHDHLGEHNSSGALPFEALLPELGPLFSGQPPLLSPVELQEEKIRSLPTVARLGLKPLGAIPLPVLRRRAEELLKKLPDEKARGAHWKTFGRAYSQLVVDWFGPNRSSEDRAVFWAEVWEPSHVHFLNWVPTGLRSLKQDPATKAPPTLKHVREVLAESPSKKIALLVLDGFSMAQWEVLKPLLREKLPERIFLEDATFGFLPSLTNVCRQALYAGLFPTEFQATIGATQEDKKHWANHRDNSHEHPAHFSLKGLTEELPNFWKTLPEKTTALALTVMFSDDALHGENLGWHGLFARTKTWAKQGLVAELISGLHARDFTVFLTSDHGHLETIGTGKLPNSCFIERPGERCAVFSDRKQRDAVAPSDSAKYMRWDDGLPETYAVLLPKERVAFETKDAISVCHGGASLDELLVPFITFPRP